MAKKVTTAKLSPARLVAERFGGIRPLAKLLEQDPSSISKWISRGGKIPNSSRHGDTHKRLLALAKREKVKLTVEELTFGGEA